MARYLHSDVLAERILLPCGRRVEITYSGDPAGKPLFFFHGFGASGLTIPPEEPILPVGGVQVIAVDRPGIGLSDPSPGRTLLDFPNDIAALADALQIERFAVLGWSGGGPYALACAYTMPERITAAGIVSSAPSFTDLEMRAYLSANWKQMAMVAQVAPWLLRLLFGQIGRRIYRDPKQALQKAVTEMAPADQALVTDSRFRYLLMGGMLAAYRHGGRGVADDALVLMRPWGFRPEEIRPKIHLWHGEADPTWPVGVGRYLAAKIPHCQATFYPSEGHLTILTHWADIVATLTA